MLDKEGITCPTSATTTVNVCTDCYRSLINAKIPRFALANHLYRGSLPVQFRDLTWVEEMVCALYRNIVHVTRLYQSSDPAQPFVFHGNTCAHETNILSTVKVLPRTPADINGMLTVVFVGATKIEAKSLRSLFRVRKQVVWSFLRWLASHNKLYQQISLDSIMDLYPEDGTVPGLAERIVY
ncbi:hypothetical protein EV424DRAFT_1321499, partial [Suillus variegatus]